MRLSGEKDEVGMVAGGVGIEAGEEEEEEGSLALGARNGLRDVWAGLGAGWVRRRL